MYFDRIASVLEDINQETDTQFENMIGDYCRVFKTSDRNRLQTTEPPKTERQDDDFLLDELHRIQSTESVCSGEMTPVGAITSLSVHSTSEIESRPVI